MMTTLHGMMIIVLQSAWLAVEVEGFGSARDSSLNELMSSIAHTIHLVQAGALPCSTSRSVYLILQAVQPLQCEDGRDKNSGILSLCDWGSQPAIFPDYTLTLLDLAAEFLRHSRRLVFHVHSGVWEAMSHHKLYLLFFGVCADNCLFLFLSCPKNFVWTRSWGYTPVCRISTFSP